MAQATFAGGCFWCTEALFQRLKGVTKVTPGYAGGKVDSPSYEEVSSGATGHREAIQIEFDPNVITYKDLVYVFMKTHDPTQEDGQGGDHGDQYMSAIYYHDEAQKKVAEETIASLKNDYDKKIITELSKFTNFFEAEDYHKNYYNENKNKNPYCRLVIDPKIKKLQENFKEFVKD